MSDSPPQKTAQHNEIAFKKFFYHVHINCPLIFHYSIICFSKGRKLISEVTGLLFKMLRQWQ
jgi:hypothetical protein